MKCIDDRRAKVHGKSETRLIDSIEPAPYSLAQEPPMNEPRSSPPPPLAVETKEEYR